MTAPTAARPAWVAELVAEYGEPPSECLDPILFSDRTRQCWAWVIGGTLHRVQLDHTDMAGRDYVAVAGREPYRRAELVSPIEPTDDEMRALVALGWGEAS